MIGIAGGHEDVGQVIARARDGDEAAWTWLYDWLAPALLGYLRARGTPQPEDALSEVFLQVVRDIDTFDGSPSSFRSWVFSIAHHRMIDQVRARNRRPADPTDDAVLTARLPSVEWESEALDHLASLELVELFQCATSAQAEVLVLRFVGALTIPEIAQVLGKPVGAVKALQRRGLAAVQDAIREGVYPLQPSWTLTAM
jgi:RNA polymerase sigma factor (sigma-70 family)